MLFYVHRLFRLLKETWVCKILLSVCMFHRPRSGMVLVSACLTIDSFSSGMTYFYCILLYCVLFFLLLKNKFDLIWFESIGTSVCVVQRFAPRHARTQLWRWTATSRTSSALSTLTMVVSKTTRAQAALELRTQNVFSLAHAKLSSRGQWFVLTSAITGSQDCCHC